MIKYLRLVYRAFKLNSFNCKYLREVPCFINFEAVMEIVLANPRGFVPVLIEP